MPCSDMEKPMSSFPEVKALDDRFSTLRISPEADARIRAALVPPRAEASPIWRFVAVAAVAGLIGLFWLRALPSGSEQIHRVGESQAVVSAPMTSACRSIQIGDELHFEGQCLHEIRELNVSIETSEQAVLAQTTDGLVMKNGSGMFRVAAAS